MTESQPSCSFVDGHQSATLGGRQAVRGCATLRVEGEVQQPAEVMGGEQSCRSVASRGRISMRGSPQRVRCTSFTRCSRFISRRNRAGCSDSPVVSR